MNYTDRVAKGAAELDRILPGWERKIDLDKLMLESDCNCVLGQLSVEILPHPPWDSPYSDAVEYLYPDKTLWVQNEWAAERGYAFGGDPNVVPPQADWNRLTEAWKRLIRQRLEAS